MTTRLQPTGQVLCHRLLERALEMNQITDISGTAALAICEALLLALNDHNILPEREILGILKDAAAAHQNGAEHEDERELHTAVAALINRILDGGNSVRRR